jgi:hypothetical protein
VAIAGLRSIVLAKKDMSDRAKREATARTIALCREMASAILLRHGKVLFLLEQKGIPLFVESMDEVSFDRDEEAKKIESAGKWSTDLTPELQYEVTGLMNAIECWSMSFTLGLADSEQAFDPCSSVFLQMVVTLYPALLYHRRTNPASGPYQNCVTLFEAWYGQRKQKEELLAQLRRTKAAKLPVPIGTE